MKTELKNEVLRRLDNIRDKLNARWHKQTMAENLSDLDWISEPIIEAQLKSRSGHNL